MEERSVLVVDDDASIQSVVQDTLSDGGFASSVASSAEEAASLLNTNKYDVLIVDISFGIDHVDGWGIARRARAFNPAFPVIYITGGNANEWAFQGVPNSILLQKPFAPAELLMALSQLLNTGMDQRGIPR
jgi:DNA-binding response OmpR family regulator